MRIEAINSDFVANVSHVDLSETITCEEVGDFERAIAHYAVLVFRDQPLTDDQHADFARRFGPIDKGLTKGSKGKRRLKNPDVIDLANVDDEGNVLAAENIRNVSLIANQFWHSDSSFKDPPAKFSILCGIELPDEGGQTEFADQRAAYDALGDKKKARIDNMVFEHFACIPAKFWVAVIIRRRKSTPCRPCIGLWCTPSPNPAASRFLSVFILAG